MLNIISKNGEVQSIDYVDKYESLKIDGGENDIFKSSKCIWLKWQFKK